MSLLTSLHGFRRQMRRRSGKTRGAVRRAQSLSGAANARSWLSSPAPRHRPEADAAVAAGAAYREWLVLVTAAVGEQFQRVGHLVIDLEHIAVGVGEIKAALIDVVGGPHDRDPVFDQMGIGVAQRRVAADLEGDVGEPDLPALRARRLLGGGMLPDVERMKILAQCHEDAAMFRVFLGDPEPEHVAVEPLRSLLVGDPQIDVPDARQLDHLSSPMSRMRASYARPSPPAS